MDGPYDRHLNTVKQMTNGNVAKGQAMQKEYGSHKGGVAGESSIGCVSYAENLLLFTHTLLISAVLVMSMYSSLYSVTNPLIRH